MRLNRQLPEWCAGKNDVGDHLDYDAWANDCSATSWVLLGLSGHLNRYDPMTEKDVIDISVGKWPTLEDTYTPE